MTTQAEKILEEAMKLPPESRADLAGSLLLSLEENFDEDVLDDWRSEVEYRLEELDSGRVRAIPREDIQNTLLLGMFLGS